MQQTSTMQPLYPAGHPLQLRRNILIGLGIALCALIVMAAGIGAVRIAPADVIKLLMTPPGSAAWQDLSGEYLQQAMVLWNIRLPRLALGILTGMALAVSGAAMQALLRNPLAEPSLVGVSGGAALFAALAIVLGGSWMLALQQLIGEFALPIFAFIGSLIATILIFAIATRQGRTSIALMLLAGIAIGALCGALIGLMTFIASDLQMRSLNFWSLGSLGAATWPMVTMVTCLSGGAICLLLKQSSALNTLALGEVQASLLGVSVRRLNQTCIAAIALAVGAVVSVTGIIGFIGLVAPHLVRLAVGPDQRLVMPAAALVGAILVLLSDLLARTIAAPTEVPVGIITALLGVPFFLALLFRMRRKIGL
ncbi:iron complex transport system permease protein [Methylobacillus rhizosphaerae]|uniref:Iron complex transport system permease protein n=1 Tax=Methylobacillus rhizosphaerae TaxID=551994 RepID=A0A238YM50_9PROT|nr:iron ABC transporter permease [Methylobacillus rhizosphaerae]SNR71878.1 iron complex transport system permease protein [Methylobacillus rhizosphaerae]